MCLSTIQHEVMGYLLKTCSSTTNIKSLIHSFYIRCTSAKQSVRWGGVLCGG